MSAHDCSECGGRGWLLMLNADTNALELQRCDSCSRFGSDTEAQEWASSNEPILVAVLFEFCDAILAESDRVVSNKKASRAALTRALTTIRDSLRNAIAVNCTRTTELESSSRLDQVGPPPTETTKRVYLVGVREVHVRHYEVQAANPEEAKSLVNQRAPEAIDVEFEEYSNELDPDTWSVEVKP